MAWRQSARSRGDGREGWSWFAALFISGWILQLVGHAFEGRRPALEDNLLQIRRADLPRGEVFFALGYKQDLRKLVKQDAAVRKRTASGLNLRGSLFSCRA